MSTTLKWLLIILGAVLIGAGAFWGGQFYILNRYKVKVLEPIEKSEKPKEAPKTETKKTETATQTDEYEGWKIYINQEIGYSLKYPTDWTIKEISTHSEVIDKDVKYLQIFNPGEKYFLHFGLKKTSHTFAVTDRTGVGAGEMTQKPADSFKVLEITVIPEAHTWNSKIVEYFYPQPSGTSTACSCEFNSSFGYNSDKVDYDAADTPNDDYKTSIKILKSAKWL